MLQAEKIVFEQDQVDDIWWGNYLPHLFTRRWNYGKNYLGIYFYQTNISEYQYMEKYMKIGLPFPVLFAPSGNDMVALFPFCNQLKVS